MVFNNTDVRAGWYIFKYRIRIQECGEDEDMQLLQCHFRHKIYKHLYPGTP